MPPAAPSLTTNAATSVTVGGATLQGTISSFGSPAGSSPVYGFVYSTTAANGTPTLGGTSVTDVPVGTASFTGNFNQAVTGLAASTGYSYQAYAINGTGTSYGGVQTFTTLAPTPSLTVSPSSLSGFSTTQGTPSAEQSYTLTGANLTTDVTVTAPNGYEVSTTSGAGFASSLTVSPAAAATSPSIYVRLTGAAVGTFGTTGSPVNITNVSTGATSRSVGVSGTVASIAPSITGLSPNTGSVGTSVTITGTNFTGATAVSFNGTAATFSVTNGTTISATVPTGATSGTVSVTTPNGTASSPSPFTVTGPTLAIYALTSVRSNDASAPATTTEPNVTAAPITRGPGINPVASTLGTFGASSWSASSLAAAQTADDYLTFTLSPTAGYLTNVSSVTVNAYRTNSGPQTLALLVSTEADFSNAVALGTQSVTATSSPGTLCSFSFNGALQNVTGTLYFRVYGYTSTGGNLYLAQSGSTNGVVIYGTTGPVTTPTIYTNSVAPSPVCAGSTLTVDYTTAGPAPTGTYTIQLSDATGSFAAPTTLATAGSTSASITGLIPAATANGTAYRVRVVNSDGTIGSASAVFTVQNASVSIDPVAAQNLNVGVGGTELTGTETPAATSRQWAVSTTSGGGYTAISGATGLTYTPSFATPGTYYVVLQSTFAACGTLTSNEVQVTITPATLAATPTTLPAFTTSVGLPSAAQTYALTGTGVVSPVTVTAPAGFEVSLNGSTFTASVLAPAAAVSSPDGQTIYVRLSGTSNSASGNVTNALGSVSVDVAVSGTALTAPGLLLAEDDFDYTGRLLDNGWASISASNTTAASAGNVTFGQYPQGAALSAGGTSNRVSLLRNSGASPVTRTVTVPAGTQTLYAAGVISVSSVENITTGSDYSLAFLQGTNNYRGRVTIARVAGSSPAVFTFRLRSSTESGFETAPTQFSLDTPYLVVLKAENSPATNNDDKFSLYVLPVGTALAQEPATPLITLQTTGNIFSTLTGFALRSNDTNNPNLFFDGFRMATGWGAVVGNPTYAGTPATINAGNYYGVTLSSGGTLTTAGGVNVENALTLSSGVLNTSTASPLTLYPTTTVSGGSNTSYVNGPVARPMGPVAAPTAVMFPLGKDAAYRPVTLNIDAQTSTTTYTAELKAAQAINQPLTGDLARVSRVRAYTITPNAQPTGFSGTVTLSFDGDDQVTDPAATSLVVAKADGSGWVNIGRSGSSGTASGGAYVAGTLTSGTFTSFSDFALASTDGTTLGLNPLPVVLTSFTAQRQVEAALLQWTTAQEKHSAFFEVQRSTNGYEFQALGRVEAAGEATSTRRYAFRDAAAPAGTVYYRLRQVDTDGTATLSGVRVLGGKEAPASLYPNPAREQLRVASAAPVKGWRVLSLTGKVLLSGTALEAGIDVSRLAAGSYALELQAIDGARTMLRFVKH